MRWQVVLTYSDPDNPDTTFSLEPEACLDNSVNALRRDLQVMADELGRTFWIARKALAGAGATKGTSQLAEVVSSAYE